MTPFHLLPVGQRFHYEGETYVKTTPLLATGEQSGKPRLIPRSAQVEYAGETPVEPSAPAPRQIAVEEARRAFEAYEAACWKLFEELTANCDDETARRAKSSLAGAHEEFLRRL